MTYPPRSSAYWCTTHGAFWRPPAPPMCAVALLWRVAPDDARAMYPGLDLEGECCWLMMMAWRAVLDTQPGMVLEEGPGGMLMHPHTH